MRSCKLCMNYLDKILAEKEREVELLKMLDLEKRWRDSRQVLMPTRDFYAALQRPSSEPLHLIAELKKASPSRGILVENFKPLELAEKYEQLGASAFSVLTDEKFFQGKADYLTMVKETFSLPTLRKDFIIDELQILEARLIGADAVLLIVAALSAQQLHDYIQYAASLDMSALVETHDETEIDIALKAGARIVGINNRDLKDFSVSLQTSLRLKKYIPEGVLSVAESGLKTNDDLKTLENTGFDAVLIGEGLLQEKGISYNWKKNNPSASLL